MIERENLDRMDVPEVTKIICGSWSSEADSKIDTGVGLLKEKIDDAMRETNQKILVSEYYCILMKNSKSRWEMPMWNLLLDQSKIQKISWHFQDSIFDSFLYILYEVALDQPTTYVPWNSPKSLVF